MFLTFLVPVVFAVLRRTRKVPMAFSIPPRPLGSRFTTLLHSYAQDDGLPFASALTEEQIQEAATAEHVNFGGGADDVYTPAVTLWGFIGQFLAGQRTCVTAVTRIIVLLIALRRKPCSAATGAYCKARAKLPEKFLRRLTYQVGNGVEDEAPNEWRWHKRRTLLVDGFETILDDTEANQKEYPQPTSQKPGLGFPMIRVVVLLAFATAALVGSAFGPHSGKESGETALFRQLLDQLRAGDIVVADRYFCSYFMIALLLRCGVDAAFRLHHKRHYDFRRGRRLGHGDHIVVWQRPVRPDWMDEATYASMPETLAIREVRFPVDNPGYRSREIIVATTLLDNQQYGFADIADLYHQRWHAELDIRSIKQTLGMNMIHCKTPAMARKALWAHFLGYNLVRKVAAQAAWEHGLCPRQISFAATVQTLQSFRDRLLTGPAQERESVCRQMFKAIAAHQVGDRPGRIEPRRLKRRNDKYPHLGVPRAQERAALLNGQE
jgi:putative transposase